VLLEQANFELQKSGRMDRCNTMIKRHSQLIEAGAHEQTRKTGSCKIELLRDGTDLVRR